MTTTVPCYGLSTSTSVATFWPKLSVLNNDIPSGCVGCTCTCYLSTPAINDTAVYHYRGIPFSAPIEQLQRCHTPNCLYTSPRLLGPSSRLPACNRRCLEGSYGSRDAVLLLVRAICVTTVVVGKTSSFLVDLLQTIDLFQLLVLQAERAYISR